MIQKINYSKKKRYWLVDYLANKGDHDFYFTLDNSRIYITDDKSINNLFKNVTYASYSTKENNECTGVLVVWKSVGGGITRNYIKIASDDYKIGDMLLKELLWNFNGELFAKIRKTSKFVPLFRKFGFRFVGGRGIQILLNKTNRVVKEKKAHG